MAEKGDLDDFFAKRDKKRPKGKKFATADDASKVLETKAKERKKAETLKYVPPLNESGEAPPALTEYKQQENEDDEWREVEEKKPDYSNLKIQELVLEDDDEEFGNKDSDKEDVDQEAKNGPWNKKVSNKDKEAKEEPKPVEEAPQESAVPVVAEAAEVAEEEKSDDVAAVETPEVIAEEPKKTGGYVPPNRRKDATATPAMPPSEDGRSSQGPPASLESGPAGAYVPPSRRGGQPSVPAPGSGAAKVKKADLNFENETSFPSLSS